MARETEISRASQGHSPPKVRRGRCYICREKFERDTMFKALCSHKFCPLCLQRFFRDALTEARFPPKCCDFAIPDTANDYLPSDLVAVLQQKEVEYGIPAEKRVFCRGCAAIIPPWNIDEKTMIGFCEQCKDKTCTRCKTYKHEGECRLQTTGDELKKMLLANKWAVCYRCNVTVEKMEDCDHLTCVCGAEFCYQCSAKWKTCACYHHEFLFDGITNANFRAAHPEITSEDQIFFPGATGEEAHFQETEEAAASVQAVDSEMETDSDQESEQSSDTEMDREVENHDTVDQAKTVTSEMDIDDQEETGKQNANEGLDQALPQDQAATKQPSLAAHKTFWRPHAHIDAAAAAQIVETTTTALSLRAPRPEPQFPKRNWACLHRDYYAIHHDGPFNCADCAVIQSTYILECKKCNIHLCVRCAELYEDFDWWRDRPPRGRSKSHRAQKAREKA
ncbi:hypothetical protein V8F06_005058 [Rhypophila decipiens]